MTAHGIMFHHFHGGEHPCVQGSISASELNDIIDQIGADNILSAETWIERARLGDLSNRDICLTFDDGLRCQYDVALPVLYDRGLTAAWFVYSSVFEGHSERLEIYRYFRTVAFPDIDTFYQSFDDVLAASKYGEQAVLAMTDFVPDNYLVDHTFYSTNDRRFRYLRDRVLGPGKYNALMDEMIANWSSKPNDLHNHLWMDEACLQTLQAQGHIIGLHSYSHPTVMADLSNAEQQREYSKNSDHLAKILGNKPSAMTHPCNSYNADTLQVLEQMGVSVGFRANMAKGPYGSLELPRVDHADFMAR